MFSFRTRYSKLKHLICEYGQLEEDLLLDKVKSVPLREQLWSNKKISLIEAISKSKSKEMFTKQMKEVDDTLYDEETKEEVNKVHKKKRDSKKEQSEIIDCGFCGRTHERNKRKCPASGEICNKCKIRNHFSIMCKSTQQRYRKIKEINTDNDGSTDFVLTVTSEKKYEKRIVHENQQKRFHANRTHARHRRDVQLERGYQFPGINLPERKEPCSFPFLGYLKQFPGIFNIF